MKCPHGAHKMESAVRVINIFGHAIYTPSRSHGIVQYRKQITKTPAGYISVYEVYYIKLVNWHTGMVIFDGEIEWRNKCVCQEHISFIRDVCVFRGFNKADWFQYALDISWSYLFDDFTPYLARDKGCRS